MLSKEEQERYSKQTILPEFGILAQERLASAKVLVIGAGGLGCPVLQYLAAAGVGTIGIVDGDDVSLSNLQRQVLYATGDIGNKKAEVAANRIRLVNPHINVNVYPVFIGVGNALEVIGEYEVVVDGSDNFATRYLVNDACVMTGKPMVSGAIYKFEGQVSVFNYDNGPTYRCLFPEAPGAGESPNCADIGVLATLPGIIGTIQANEVIKLITGVGEVLSGRFLVVDTLNMVTQVFRFGLVPANREIAGLQDFYDVPCTVPVVSISYESLVLLISGGDDIQLVDVREVDEHKRHNIGGINIPQHQLEQNLNQLDADKQTVLYCASGVRSGRAAILLLQKGFRQVVSLGGGIRHLNLQHHE